jgi:hypothetical protein
VLVWDLLSPEFEEAVLVGVGFDESRDSLSVTMRYLVSRLYCTALTCVTHIYHHHTLMVLAAAAACRRGVNTVALQGQRATEQFK